MDNIKLILFDLDDTLFDFKKCFEFGMKAAMRLHPLTTNIETDALYIKFKYFSDSLWYLFLEKNTTFNKYRQIRIQTTLEEYGIIINEEIADEFNCLFNTKYLEAISPSTLTLNLLSKLAKKFELGIVTNGAPDLVYKKIINLGIGIYFSKNNVFVSEDVGFSKPHPEIFKIALSRFGIEARETLFVGDSWSADIVGAINVGISAIWLNIEKSKPLTDHLPLAIIEDLEELESILCEI